MIKINDILEIVNNGFKTHYFKDIKTFGVTELVTRTDIEGEEISTPAIYVGNGNYEFIQDDTNGLNIYHRIDGVVDNDEDQEKGFGRNSMTTETYSIKTVFYGQQAAIEKSIEDLNFNLAKEFKKLVPRRLNVSGEHRTTIKVGEISYNKEDIQEAEGLKSVPESILFTLDLDVKITTLEECNNLSCDASPILECDVATILDSDGVTFFEVDSGGSGTCTPSTPKSGIAFNYPQLTGQTTSYDLYDDAWQVANNPYPSNPSNPTHTAELSDFFTLKANNKHDNTLRFTDEDGLEVYGNNYVEDHFTGLAWGVSTFSEGVNWTNVLVSANGKTINGFSDYRLPNINEQETIGFRGNTATTGFSINYAPFNITFLGSLYTSTTRPDSVASYMRYEPHTGGLVGEEVKSLTSRLFLVCRTM